MRIPFISAESSTGRPGTPLLPTGKSPDPRTGSRPFLSLAGILCLVSFHPNLHPISPAGFHSLCPYPLQYKSAPRQWSGCNPPSPFSSDGMVFIIPLIYGRLLFFGTGFLRFFLTGFFRFFKANAPFVFTRAKAASPTPPAQTMVIPAPTRIRFLFSF